MKHCGKTTLGRILASRLRLNFTDLDALIEETASREKGKPVTVREIYKEGGKEAFEAAEKTALLHLAQHFQAGKQLVLALGGGSIENTEAFSALAERAFLIYLEEDEKTLFRRITAKGLPPFLEGPNPRETFHRLYEKRTALYREKAHYTLNLRGLTPEETLEKLLAHDFFTGLLP
ncbi:MAG: shikimate kinase [Spirochaetales bacterium]|nr:shikimate kinase [Spirochaetales bacterium]